MRQYNNILVIIEPKRDYQLALHRAIEMARFNPKVTITALRLIYDFSNEVDLLGKKNEIKTHEEVEQLTRVAVTKTIAQALEEHPQKLTTDINIVPKVQWVNDLSEGMLKETNSGQYDLLIKGANHHGLLDSIFFTPHDWYLLRHATIPVVITKEHTWDESSSIVVAVDFTSTEKKAMNVLLLREAQSLSKITKAPIHLVNSAPVVLPTVMLEVPNYAPELYAESILNEHKARIIEFANRHNIPAEHCHIAEGMPDDVIPKVCQKLNAKTVFIGSLGRVGVSAALIGNTCEEIVDFLNADLFVLNRKTLVNSAAEEAEKEEKSE